MDRIKNRRLIEELTCLDGLSSVFIKYGRKINPIDVFVSIGKDIDFEKRKDSFPREQLVVFLELKEGQYFLDVMLAVIAKKAGLQIPNLIEKDDKTFLYRFS